MSDNKIAKAEIIINAPTEEVWEALTNPDKVKQWLFGTEMSVSEWKVGGQIRYRGVWQDKPYEDKGEILEIEPRKKLVSTYWSGLSGQPDLPENYQRVSYLIQAEGERTSLTIIQEGDMTEESAKHSENNWNQVLQNLKKICE